MRCLESQHKMRQLHKSMCETEDGSSHSTDSRVQTTFHGRAWNSIRPGTTRESPGVNQYLSKNGSDALGETSTSAMTKGRCLDVVMSDVVSVVGKAADRSLSEKVAAAAIGRAKNIWTHQLAWKDTSPCVPAIHTSMCGLTGDLLAQALLELASRGGNQLPGWTGPGGNLWLGSEKPKTLDPWFALATLGDGAGPKGSSLDGARPHSYAVLLQPRIAGAARQVSENGYFSSFVLLGVPQEDPAVV
eukprot:5410076-Amphidinium_carterae.4